MSARIGVLYVETSGTNTHIEGFGDGIVTGTKLGPGLHKPVPVLAFVRLDEGGMLAVNLGAVVRECDCWSRVVPEREHNPQCRTLSDREAWREAISARVISRDEFDAITGIAAARYAEGWRA